VATATPANAATPSQKSAPFAVDALAWTAAATPAADTVAARYYGLANEAAVLVEYLGDAVANAGVALGLDHPLAVRADECERGTWAAFSERVRTMRGEGE
jgi:hypothetical protein